MRLIKTVCFEPEVFEALEQIRGKRQHATSKLINDFLRQAMGLTFEKVRK